MSPIEDFRAAASGDVPSNVGTYASYGLGGLTLVAEQVSQSASLGGVLTTLIVALLTAWRLYLGHLSRISEQHHEERAQDAEARRYVAHTAWLNARVNARMAGIDDLAEFPGDGPHEATGTTVESTKDHSGVELPVDGDD